ncbi:MAG: hypothetical protein M0R17_08595 [Candidatus Omnitrophica bacterium]|jgi:hypothetical protein|nr:hypothetical protein [Candidatus Omnitrophota bacterium]
MKTTETSNEYLLEKLRLEHPLQVINKIISVKENTFGFYDVGVDMESMFFDTKILHTIVYLPYPITEYEKLSQHEQTEWRLNYMV